jgi:hypothetical protein
LTADATSFARLYRLAGSGCVPARPGRQLSNRRVRSDRVRLNGRRHSGQRLEHLGAPGGRVRRRGLATVSQRGAGQLDE